MPGPVFLIGAGRSGTKLLRSVVAAAAEYQPVEFDVPYIWRYGNEDHPDDAIPPERATPRIGRFIRRQLRRCAGLRPDAPQQLVEKTVGNVMRTPFVYEIFPDARFVFLIRDGRDVIESAERCWREPPQMGYLLAKLKTFPWTACAGYGARYARGIAGRALGISRQLPTWGQIYPGMADDVARLDLLDVCALQWTRSIETFEADRQLLPADRLIEVRYEDLVRETEPTVARLCEFLEVADPEPVEAHAGRAIEPGNIGKARRLTPRQEETIERIAGPVLARWGYLQESLPT